MERETALAQRLRRIDYDLSCLTESQRTEIYDLARLARVELWQPGKRWPSSPGSSVTGGGITPNPGRP